MPHLSVWEILIIVLVIVILFGAGRIAKAGGELGKGIKAFKDGLQGKDEQTNPENDPVDYADDGSQVEQDPAKLDK
jgi:sec-independent protein translocase protein TatA